MRGQAGRSVGKAAVRSGKDECAQGIRVATLSARARSRQCGAAQSARREHRAAGEDVRMGVIFPEPGIALAMCASAQTTLPGEIYVDLIR